MYKVWLIQNVIAPYRIRLFEEIANHADFDFSVVLTAPVCNHRPHWRFNEGRMPFKVRTMQGFNTCFSHDGSVSFSYGLLFSLFRHRPDIVICGGFGLSTLLVYLYTKVFRKEYIVWTESTPITEELRGLGPVRKRLRRLMAANAEAFVDAGTLSRKYIQSLIPAKRVVLYFRSFNCVDATRFSSEYPGREMALRKTGSVSYPRILFVGRLNKNKGIPMLLGVYREIVKNCPVTPGLVLVGEGTLDKYVERIKHTNGLDRMQIEGQVPYEQIASYYKECDLFVLLSQSDCNPLVILESLHAGIPILCTNRAGNAIDFIVAGENGFIVDPTNKDEIVRRTIDVLHWTPAKRAACSQFSRNIVKKANYRDSAQAFIDACHTIMPPQVSASDEHCSKVDLEVAP